MKEVLIASLKKHPEILPVLFEDNGEWLSCGALELADGNRSCTRRECLLIPFRGVWQAVALIGSLPAILTTKLHVGIVAYALDVYAKSFSTHPKLPRFYRLIDRASQCSSIETLEKSEMLVKLARTINHATGKYDIRDGTWKSIKGQAERGKEFVSGFVSSCQVPVMLFQSLSRLVATRKLSPRTK